MGVNRPCGTFNETFAQEFIIIRTPCQWLLTVLGLLAFVTLPLYCSGHVVSIVNLIGISLLAVLGLNILTGYCGQISIGQAAFMCVGAFTSAILVRELEFSFWLALPCAALAAGVCGLLFALPALRVKGFYLAMTTLAAQFIIPWVFGHVQTDITGGVLGITVPAISVFGKPILSQAGYFYVIMPLVMLGIYLARNLARSRVGRAFIAIRDNDLAAEVMGINLFKHKLLAFFICSVYAGVAGALWAPWMRAIHPEHFDLTSSIWYLGMLIIGGMGSISGACFGTIFVVGLDEASKRVGPVVEVLLGGTAATLIPSIRLVVFGFIVILFLMFEPRGLAHRWQIFKTYYRLWPFPY